MVVYSALDHLESLELQRVTSMSVSTPTFRHHDDEANFENSTETQEGNSMLLEEDNTQGECGLTRSS